MSSERTFTPDAAGTADRDRPCPLGSGDVLAERYAVELLIGEGTFGWVLAALDVVASPPRRVALKVLRHHYAAQDEVLRRFERRELALLRRVEAANPTPHVVRAHEPALLWHEGLPFLVLEFIDGPSLREVLERGPLEPTRIGALGIGLARGLASLHAAGGVHRDLKPTNIRLRGGQEPVIVDLGISRALWMTQELTEPGPAAMTPLYASPEQLAGREVGPASDVYSLGLILYELLTGELPSVGEEPGKRLAARRGHLPQALREWVPRCLERDPARRPTALELATALAAPPASPGRSRALRWGAGAGAVLLLALGGAMASRFQEARAPAAPPEAAGPPWSLRWGDAAKQSMVRIALDARGQLFVAGQLRGSVDPGTGPLTSAGSNDVLVARLDPGGRALWGRRFGDSGLQNVTQLASDSAGGVVLTGGFTETLDFDGQRLFNPGDQDIFLARLDPEGRTLWSRQFGDVSEQLADGLAVDPQGHVVITGTFHGTVDFGDGALVSEGLSDVFLARFTPEGRLLWSRRFGDAQAQRPTGLAVDAEGHIALTGVFEGSIDFGDGVLTHPSGRGHFVALFDADGQLRWSRQRGGAGEPHGGPVAFDSTGHVVVVERDSRPGTTGFSITRFSPEGHLLWSRRFEGSGNQDALGVAAAPGKRIVVTGVVQGDLDFGDGPLVGQGGWDVLVLELGLEGKLLGARRFGDAAHQFGQAVAVDAAGSVVVAGAFDGTLDFGGGPLPGAGEQDFFIARLAPAAPVAEGGTCLPPLPGLVASYPFEGALRLDGGFFEAPDAEGLDFGEGPLSVSAWIRTTRAEGIQSILDKRREPTDGKPIAGYHLFVHGGRLGFQLGDNVGSGGCGMLRSAGCTNYRSGHFVADGAWHFVTVTVERGSPFGGTFYVDGVAVSRFDPTVRTGSLDNDRPLRIGSRSSSETGLFRGFVDEVALWNRALTAAEVERLYRAGRVGLCRAQSSESSRSP
jgi:outer membrane protein assembly factor BamB